MTTSIYLGGSAAEPLAQRILRFPVTRIVLALVFFMVPFLLMQAGATHFLKKNCSRAWRSCWGPAWGAWREYGAGFVLGGLMVCASPWRVSRLWAGYVRCPSRPPASSPCRC